MTGGLVHSSRAPLSPAGYMRWTYISILFESIMRKLSEFCDMWRTKGRKFCSRLIPRRSGCRSVSQGTHVDHALLIGTDARFATDDMCEDTYAASLQPRERAPPCRRADGDWPLTENDQTLDRLVLTGGIRVDRWTIRTASSKPRALEPPTRASPDRSRWPFSAWADLTGSTTSSRRAMQDTRASACRRSTNYTAARIRRGPFARRDRVEVTLKGHFLVL